MSFADVLNLCGKVTVAQLLTRDDFSKRMKAETPIYLHECLYPLMQAWTRLSSRRTSNWEEPSSCTRSCWPATCRRTPGCHSNWGDVPILVEQTARNAWARAWATTSASRKTRTR
ncbi:MAG: hypothetical protein R3B91_19840 [Planctomycetaceae bacterium]